MSEILGEVNQIYPNFMELILFSNNQNRSLVRHRRKCGARFNHDDKISLQHTIER